MNAVAAPYRITTGNKQERLLCYVFTAARRLMSCEKHGLIDDNDDWIHHGLRTYRQTAKAAGIPQEAIDKATMDGCVAGWEDT